MNTGKDILSAWYEVLLEAAEKSDAKNQLLRREHELLPRFASQYANLSALPRRMRRALQRQWKSSLAGIAMLVVLGQTPALAATINVGGNCTLGRAITSANNDTAVGGCTRGSGADRVVLPRNSTQTLTEVNSTNYGPTGLPTVRSTMTIDGNGSTIRRAPSAPNFRIFAVTGPGKLTLQETTVSGGVAPGVFPSNTGGGLFMRYNAVVALTNSTISGNRAVTGGGVYNGDDTSFTASNSSISGNNGHGLFVGEVAQAILTNSTVSGKTDDGVRNSYLGFTTLTNSTVANNQGAGVVGIEYTSLMLTNSTVSGNASDGVFAHYSYPSITNSTISSNGRWGLFNFGNDGYATVTNTTITRNQNGGVYNGFGASVILVRALVSGNTAARARGREIFVADGLVSAGKFDVLGHRGLNNAQAFANFTPGATDITATSNGNNPTPLAAILNTNLANNGGPTRTHALVAGSPAVDSVSDGTCPPPARDQRGVQRPQDGNGDGGPACDTGSYERR